MSLHNVKIGDKSPEIVNVVVEIPKNSQNKYEFDEVTGAIHLDLVLFSPMHYPADYGFIPETRSEDGDHLDALILCSDPTFPGCVVKMRPIGILKMVDGGEEDFKILGVQKDNPRFENVKDIKHLHSHSLKEISHFFQAYKELEGKKTQIKGWGNAQVAKKEIKDAIKREEKRVAKK